MVGLSVLLSLASAQYSDNGRYICTATIMEDNSEVQTISTLFYVNLEGYEAPRKRGVGQFGLIKTSEQTLVDCPVVGVPGPVTFYWERGEDFLNTTGYKRVTMATNVTTGPFVNTLGQLDLSRATEDDTMFYLCTGVDVAGASASQLFRIDVVVQDVFVLWVQWYMILVYCVVGVVIVVLLVGVMWFICANRQECCVKVTKREVVKTRMTRKELMSHFPSPLEQTFDIDKQQL